ncbi:MAG: hypothetical protein IT306_16555 [Chloroflexi bacterium]|nr:hypothetical protein [Chloroflexota bacterium]
MSVPGEQQGAPGSTPSRRARRADRTYVPPPSDARGRSIPACLASGQRLIVAEGLALLLGIGLLVFVDGAFWDGAGGRIDFAALRRSLQLAGLGDAVLALPAHDGDETAVLRSMSREERAPSTLPMFDESPVTPVDGPKLQAIVGSIDGPARDEPSADGVICCAVSRRDAEAARDLLALEVDTDASAMGSAGFAALLRYLQEDRRRPIRARWLPPDPLVVVLVRPD